MNLKNKKIVQYVINSEAKRIIVQAISHSIEFENKTYKEIIHNTKSISDYVDALICEFGDYCADELLFTYNIPNINGYDCQDMLTKTIIDNQFLDKYIITSKCQKQVNEFNF